MNKLDVEIHGLKNFSFRERKKFLHAMDEMQYHLNSQEFKNAVLSHDFDKTNGRTNGEIYTMIMSGADRFNKLEDKDIDIHLTMFYSRKRTIGYTYPSTWWTWINRKFFNGFNNAEIAMNVVHENLGHNLGFNHDSPSQHDSVPYALGFIMRDLIKGKVPPRRYTRKKRVVYRKPWYRRIFSWLRRR